MPSAGFESAIPASQQPQTHGFDRAATGTGNKTILENWNVKSSDWAISEILGQIKVIQM
jgi:hypothetical protein